MKKQQWESMGVRVRGLMIAAGAIKDSIKKGNTLVEGINGSYLSDITSYSSQLKGDFNSLNEEFKAGRLSLQDYAQHLNVFISMFNAGVTDEQAIGAEDIKKEALRVKQLIENGNTAVGHIAKAKVDDPILNNQELIKANIYACYGNTTGDRLENKKVNDPITKATKLTAVGKTSAVTKESLDKVFDWLEAYTSNNK